MNKLKILATGYDYRPSLGGVASCSFELFKAMHQSQLAEVKVIARRLDGGEEFDRGVPFETKRISIPRFSPAAASVMAAQLSEEILKFKPDAILNPLWIPGGVGSYLASPARVVTHTPYFLLAHGVEVIESSRTFKKRLRSRLQFMKHSVFDHATKIFAVSRFTRGLVEEYCGVNAAKIMVVNNGVNAEEFSPGPPSPDLIEKYGLKGKRVLLTISRLEDYKGVDRVISSLRFVVPHVPEIKYVVCGEGPDCSRLEKLARHYRVQNNVVFAGAVPFETRRDFYNCCDAFILLSRSDLERPNVEGFGLVFLEAAACGKPSIGGLSGGIPDAVIDGETGWLVDPHDDRAIAARITTCFQNKEGTAQIGERARLRATSSQTWHHAATKIMTEIKSHVRN